MAQASAAVEFETLKKTIGENSKKKIRLEERLSNATENMKKVVGEVRTAGYDPKTLEAVRSEKSEAFTNAVAALATDVQAQSEAISAIEAAL